MKIEAIEELRMYLDDPIIEAECGSVENFVQNVIDWAGQVERLALRARDEMKDTVEVHDPTDPLDRMYENEIVE